MSYRAIIHGVGCLYKRIHQCLSHRVGIVLWSYHHPHDYLSLALCLLTNCRQASAPRLKVTELEPHSGAAINRESADHISPEYQSLNAHRDINNTHGWYFRWLRLEHGVGGQGHRGSRHEAELWLQSMVWITARVENDHYNCVGFLLPSAIYCKVHLSLLYFHIHCNFASDVHVLTVRQSHTRDFH